VGTAKKIVSCSGLEAGQMSQNARTVVWVDWPEDQPGPGDLKVITRGSDGAWSKPITIGKVGRTRDVYDFRFYYRKEGSAAAVLSADGRTVVWLDEDLALTRAVKAADGPWTSAGTVKDYAGVGGVSLRTLRVSSTGSTAMWVRGGVDGIITAQRTSTGWGTAVMATVDNTAVEVMGPRGTSIAWITGAGDAWSTSRRSGSWAKGRTVGSVFYGSTSQLVMVNRTLAYGSIGVPVLGPGLKESTCAVSTSLLVGGKWLKGMKLASSVCHPAVSYDGRTIVWGNLKTKTLQSVKR
jgi:hypothetical protein